jgi:hypothetical protein
MGRKSVEADELDMDVLQQACVALQLTDEQCAIIREAAEELCKGKRQKGKRELSEYQIFLSKCMREKKIKKFEEASSAMKECVGEWKEQKK